MLAEWIVPEQNDAGWRAKSFLCMSSSFDRDWTDLTWGSLLIFARRVRSRTTPGNVLGPFAIWPIQIKRLQLRRAMAQQIAPDGVVVTTRIVVLKVFHTFRCSRSWAEHRRV